MTLTYLERAKLWQTGSFDDATKEEVAKMVKDDPNQLEDAFYKTLSFGTGGLRGVMGVGTNRINRYTIGMATQGLSNYLMTIYGEGSDSAVAISYDSRNRSKEYAEITASVFIANGFKVYLSDEIRPTPLLSYAIRHYKCVAGVMITASHNPPEYNGYKVYWGDGAQIIAPHDISIINEVNSITDISEVNFADSLEKIIYFGKELDNLYLSSVIPLALSNSKSDTKRKIGIVYTPLHGTGVRIVPEILKTSGFTKIYNVPKQDISDGSFPTVKSPNPEDSSAMQMALDRAAEEGAHVVMATDPDADRLGIAVRDKDSNLILLNGNQMAVILTYYLLERWRESGLLKDGKNRNHYIVKTIVTTDLLKNIAEHYGVAIMDVLTGFKYIAEIIRDNEGKRTFICGGEESYGFNVGEYVRDKDAVISSLIVAEAAAWSYDKGMTLYDLLIEAYLKFGFFKEGMISLTKKGIDGAREISEIMKKLREQPLEKIGDSPVISVYDYKNALSVDLISDLKYEINLPKSDVIQFISADNSIISVRPSGTEPKIKFYLGVKDQLDNVDDFKIVEAALDKKLTTIAEQLEYLFGDPL